MLSQEGATLELSVPGSSRNIIAFFGNKNLATHVNYSSL